MGRKCIYILVNFKGRNNMQAKDVGETNSIKMDLNRNNFEHVKWNQLAQQRVESGAFVGTVMDVWIP